MKTHQIMNRDFGFGTVRQNYKTGFGNLHDIEVLCNARRNERFLKPKRLKEYWQTNESQEYLDILLERALSRPESFPYLPKEIQEVVNGERLVLMIGMVSV